MADIIGVKFKPGGKLYYFDPKDQYLLQGSHVVVETARGLECGEVVMERRSLPDDEITHELKSVIREATEEDMRRVAENRRKEVEAFAICEEKIAARGLDMKLVSVEFAFDGSKILFCFTSDGRVDFRELVKDLAGVFHVRIELRQIGVRDEAKLLGGLGICGRPFCCSSFMGDFIPVTIKMAKEQGLSLNPVKISGTCGRLMCCLKYEEEAYEDLLRHTPRVGNRVSTPEGSGVISDVNLLTGQLYVRMDDAPDAPARQYNKAQLKIADYDRKAPGFSDATVLELTAPAPKKEEEEYSFFGGELTTAEPEVGGNTTEQPRRSGQQGNNRSRGKNGHGSRPGGKGRSGQPRQNAQPEQNGQPRQNNQTGQQGNRQNNTQQGNRQNGTQQGNRQNNSQQGNRQNSGQQGNRQNGQNKQGSQNGQPRQNKGGQGKPQGRQPSPGNAPRDGQHKQGSQNKQGGHSGQGKHHPNRSGKSGNGGNGSQRPKQSGEGGQKSTSGLHQGE